MSARTLEKQPRLLLCLHSHTQKIIGLHVRADQEFLPSQSGPINWKLTCALTPHRGRISEHGNTKSGKRKTLIDFTCFLMHLPHCLCPHCYQKPIQRLYCEVTRWFSPYVPQVAAHVNACSWTCVVLKNKKQKKVLNKRPAKAR